MVFIYDFNFILQPQSSTFRGQRFNSSIFYGYRSQPFLSLIGPCVRIAPGASYFSTLNFRSPTASLKAHPTDPKHRKDLAPHPPVKLTQQQDQFHHERDEENSGALENAERYPTAQVDGQ